MFSLANDIDPAIYTITDNTTPDDCILKLEAREKEREHRCPDCNSRRLRRLDPVPNTKRCMYHGQPAKCFTARTYFECRACGKKFFGDKNFFDAHVSRSFTAEFIMHAIKLWLTDINASFNDVAKSLEISLALMEEWHTDLYKKFAEKTKISCKYALLLYAFNRPRYMRRGVAFAMNSKDDSPRIVSFIENYTLKDVAALLETFPTDHGSIQLLYYSYIAGLGDRISSLYEKPKHIAVNIDMLHDELITLLSDKPEDVNKKITKALGVVYALESESAEADKIVEEFNAIIDEMIQMDSDNTDRNNLLDQYRINGNEFRYFVSSDIVESIGGRVFDNPLSDIIQDMTAANQSFYAIALKILYDNSAFKGRILDKLSELAEQKRSEYMKKRLERKMKTFINDEQGCMNLIYNKESPAAAQFDIFGLPEVEGFSVPVKSKND